MLKVELNKILPVTEARANIAKLIDEVVKGNLYVLTRGGKPAAIVAPVDYLEKDETGYEENIAREIDDEGALKTESISDEDKEKIPAGIDLKKVEKVLAASK